MNCDGMVRKLSHGKKMPDPQNILDLIHDDDDDLAWSTGVECCF